MVTHTDPRSSILWQTNFSGWIFQRHFQHTRPGISSVAVILQTNAINP